MDDNPTQCLIHHSKEDYGDSFGSDLLEQYKLYVQSAENVSTRRVASNRFMLTINAALVALYGLQSANFGQGYWTLLIPVIGVPVSVLWYLIIKSHADLNSIKFKVIHKLEEHLPAAVYKYEWQLAGEGKGKSYRAVTRIERCIPIMFAGLHVVLAIVIILCNRWRHGLDKMTTITEADVEQATLSWLSGLGWQAAHGADIAPDTPNAERDDYGQVVLERRLRDALAQLNPGLPADALDDAYRKLTRPEGSTLEARNRAFHRMLVNGVEIEYRDSEGRVRRRPGTSHRLRERYQQRLAGCQPVHRHRGRKHSKAGRRAVRQRLAPGRHRAEEPRGRGRHHLDGVAAAPDLQGRSAGAVLHERGTRGLGWDGGTYWHADRRAGVVQALAHRHR